MIIRSTTKIISSGSCTSPKFKLNSTAVDRNHPVVDNPAALVAADSRHNRTQSAEVASCSQYSGAAFLRTLSLVEIAFLHRSNCSDLLVDSERVQIVT